jgi:hypothetical protein
MDDSRLTIIYECISCGHKFSETLVRTKHGAYVCNHYFCCGPTLDSRHQPGNMIRTFEETGVLNNGRCRHVGVLG